jgi:hypothetical protein
MEFTPEEEADLGAWRQTVQEDTIAKMHEGIERLSESFPRRPPGSSH